MPRIQSRRRRAGTASMEFAICAPFMFGMFAVMADVGNLLRARITLATAVAAAAEYAVLAGPTVTTANIQSVMQSVGTASGLTVIATVAAPGCYCPSAYPVSFSTATCGSTCASNSLAPNTYVVISGKYTYAPIATHMSKVVSTVLTETATVPLK